MWHLLIFIALVAVAAVFGAQFPPGEWYAGLAKAPWTPPNWVFSPVWTLLYLAIAGAGWLVWRSSSARTQPLLALWSIQLVLNALWSWLFFGAERPGLALILIAALFVAIAVTAALFARLNRAAAAFLLPYLVWVGFASLLNFEVWRLN